MEYRRLGNSGLKVSAVGLGGNNFGARANQEASISVINHALELGINFVDTAALYAQERSEEIVGQAIQRRRSQVIVATKFGHPTDVSLMERGGSRSYIIKAVDDSLRRLNTDYIDLYYMHHPDPETPIEETLRTLDDLIRSGKVRYIGYSNCAAWQLCDALWTSRLYNLASFVVAQLGYNLLDRSIERELVPCCKSHDIGIIPWGPLARGFLTGKYKRGQEIPAEWRLSDPLPIYDGIITEANFDKLAKLESFASERGHSVGEFAIAWLLSRPWLASVIAGAINAEQLSANVAAIGWKLTEENITQLDSII